MQKAIVLALAASLAASPALAFCTQHPILLNALKKKGEERVGAGKTGTQLLEVWANKENGKFTIILTGTRGFSCIIGGGTGWISGEKTKKGNPI